MNPVPLSRINFYNPTASFVLTIAILVLNCGHTQQGNDFEFAPRAKGIFLTNPSYVLDYDVESRLTNWVHYRLDASECLGKIPRKDDFRADGRVGEDGVDHLAYRGSGYDRGHLKPAADSKSSYAEMSNSFLMTNMAPQTPNLNRGIWKRLEDQTRDWALEFGSVHVSCGPGFETYDWLSSCVRVPEGFWKIVLRLAPDTAALAFYFPNAEQVTGSLADYTLSVDSLERMIRLDLMPALPDSTEMRIEAIVPNTIWSTHQSTHSTEKQPENHSKAPTRTGRAVQCMGIAKSTGNRCRQKTTDPTGYCRYHRD